jgi:hypothetical protein
VSLIPWIGLVLASAAFVAAFFYRHRMSVAATAGVAAAFGLMEAGVLASVFDVFVEKEIVGRAIWLWLGY